MNASFTPETAMSLMQQTQNVSPIITPENVKNAQRIKEAAQEFEAVFFAEMLKPMFEGIEADETFGGGKGEEIFRGMMIQEYGKEIAKKNITGIQAQVQNALIELQAERTKANLTPAHESGKIIDLDILEETP